MDVLSFNIALVEKCGCNKHNHVNVLQLLSGMDFTVLQILALMAEPGMNSIVLVYALIIKFGMVKDVFLLKFHVTMDKSGIKISTHAHALQVLILVEILVNLFHYAQIKQYIIL